MEACASSRLWMADFRDATSVRGPDLAYRQIAGESRLAAVEPRIIAFAGA
jgi:hypothetical protein